MKHEFKKGHPKMGGREKGTKNKSYLSLNYWVGWIADNAENLSNEKKIEVAFRVVNILAPKVANLPTEPGDSVDNAFRTQVLLSEIETKAKLAASPQTNGTNGTHADA